MAKRERSTITSEERNRWLDEFEKENEKGITKITATAGRDIRTVKRHIEIARREREIGRVRHDFLLGRLELHNEDLLDEARRLTGILVSHVIQSLEPTDGVEKLVHHALVGHIKRLAVFSLLARWEDAARDYKLIRDKLRGDLESEERRLVDGLPSDSLFEWTPKVASDQDEMLIFGKTYEFEYTKNKESPDSTKIQIDWGSTHLTKKYLDESNFDSVIEAHKQMRLFADKQLVEFRPQYSELTNLASKIADALEVLLMRRFVPGKCQYCPF